MEMGYAWILQARIEDAASALLWVRLIQEHKSHWHALCILYQSRHNQFSKTLNWNLLSCFCWLWKALRATRLRAASGVVTKASPYHWRGTLLRVHNQTNKHAIWTVPGSGDQLFASSFSMIRLSMQWGMSWSVHFLLLIHTQLAGTHVHQKKKTSPEAIVNI